MSLVIRTAWRGTKRQSRPLRTDRSPPMGDTLRQPPFASGIVSVSSRLFRRFRGRLLALTESREFHGTTRNSHDESLKSITCDCFLQSTQYMNRSKKRCTGPNVGETII